MQLIWNLFSYIFGNEPCNAKNYVLMKIIVRICICKNTILVLQMKNDISAA